MNRSIVSSCRWNCLQFTLDVFFYCFIVLILVSSLSLDIDFMPLKSNLPFLLLCHCRLLILTQFSSVSTLPEFCQDRFSLYLSLAFFWNSFRWNFILFLLFSLCSCNFTPIKSFSFPSVQLNHRLYTKIYQIREKSLAIFLFSFFHYINQSTLAFFSVFYKNNSCYFVTSSF